VCMIHKEAYARSGRIEDEAFETLILFQCHSTNKSKHSFNYKNQPDYPVVCLKILHVYSDSHPGNRQ